MGLVTAVLFAALAPYASAHCAQNSDCSSFPDLNGFHFFCNNDEHAGFAGECETCYYPGDIPHDSEACVMYVTACCYTGQSERRDRCECEDDEAEFQNIEAHKETEGECPGGHANLRIDLYDGVVRDADTDDWLDWGDSDAYCVFYVGEASETFTGLFINSNTPVYNEFMDFSCQRTDAGIRLHCYDRDEWSDDDPIFSTHVNDWPPSGVKTRWYDEVTEAFYFDVALIYGHGVAPHNGHDFNAGENDDQDDDQDEEKRKRVGSAGLFLLMIILMASFCCGAAFVQTLRKNREPNFEITGVEMAAAVDIIDLAQATVIPDSDVKDFETVELGGGGPEAAPTPRAVA